MNLTFKDLVNNDLVIHTKLTISNQEKITYYINKNQGWDYLPYYKMLSNGSIQQVDTFQNYNLSPSTFYEDYIQEIFKKLDELIDLDFEEMPHNNGSMIDIYQVSYSSNFSENVIGQAVPQQTINGSWWDIFWKNSPEKGIENINSNKNTIVHEIGHTLGLGHPFDDPNNNLFTSEDSIMSYNRGSTGWDTWFSETDLNSLISIWGREDDLGFINLPKNSFEYKYKREVGGKYHIKTKIGFEEITDLEYLKFTDKSLNVEEEIINVFDSLKELNSIESKIYRLYNAAFGRFPDFDGLNYWIEKNNNLSDTYKDTAKSFIKSQEFEFLYGKESTNNQFITNLYSNVLKRNPDFDGFQYWSNQLDSGLENRSEILIGFSESLENKSLFSAETAIF